MAYSTTITITGSTSITNFDIYQCTTNDCTSCTPITGSTGQNISRTQLLTGHTVSVDEGYYYIKLMADTVNCNNSICMEIIGIPRPTVTITPTPTTVTLTPTPTSTSTITPTPTSTSTPTPTSTSTITPTPTSTNTPTPTSTDTPTPTPVSGFTFTGAEGCYTSFGYSPTSGNEGVYECSGTLTVTGASYDFGTRSSVYTSNNTTVMTYLIIDGSNQLYSEHTYNQSYNAVGSHDSTTLTKGPGTYSFTFHCTINGTGGSGNGTITGVAHTPSTPTPTPVPGVPTSTPAPVCRYATVTNMYTSGNILYTTCNGSPGSSYLGSGTTSYSLGCIREYSASGPGSVSYDSGTC